MNDDTTIAICPVEGRSLPLETAPRRRVDKPMRVPNTDYYRRAIAKGDIALDDTSTEPAPTSAKKR